MRVGFQLGRPVEHDLGTGNVYLVVLQGPTDREPRYRQEVIGPTGTSLLEKLDKTT